MWSFDRLKEPSRQRIAAQPMICKGKASKGTSTDSNSVSDSDTSKLDENPENSEQDIDTDIKPNNAELSQTLKGDAPNPVIKKKRIRCKIEPTEECLSENDVLPDKTDTTEEHTTKDGMLSVKKFGLKKFKKPRVYHCPICGVWKLSLKNFSTHYGKRHDKLTCSKCLQQFNSPASPAEHQYVHGELKYDCRTCGKCFAFSSQRNSHRLTHRCIKDQVCNQCGKHYMSKGDLKKHVKTHPGVTWKCDQCRYETKDKRLLKSHMWLHSNILKYSCPHCLKKFKYQTQYSRHCITQKCPNIPQTNSSGGNQGTNQ